MIRATGPPDLFCAVSKGRSLAGRCARITPRRVIFLKVSIMAEHRSAVRSIGDHPCAGVAAGERAIAMRIGRRQWPFGNFLLPGVYTMPPERMCLVRWFRVLRVAIAIDLHAQEKHMKHLKPLLVFLVL